MKGHYSVIFYSQLAAKGKKMAMVDSCTIAIELFAFDKCTIPSIKL